ncbi:MAG: alpha/beta family hydrolase [Candidatus Eisenbacteria bacterium]
MLERSGSLDVGRPGQVDTLLLVPGNVKAMLSFAHGAGAGMRHPFLAALCEKLGERGVATFRYQFPYMQKGNKRIDSTAVLLATVGAAWGAGAAAAEDAAAEAGVNELPLFAGGKSMGGRITSMAAAAGSLDRARGLVFVGYPLQSLGGTAGQDRTSHLFEIRQPMLFLQGTRDRLTPIDAIRTVCREIGARATLHVVDDADHSFRVPKRTGRTGEDVIAELAQAISDWIDARI